MTCEESRKAFYGVIMVVRFIEFTVLELLCKLRLGNICVMQSEVAAMRFEADNPD
jgi:hypothetical protein